MAVELIRKNNKEGITAYQDAVLFHLAKGANGIIPSVDEELKLTYNSVSKTLVLGSGQGIAFGRQFQVPAGEDVIFDISTLTGPKYLVIYAEIHLADPTNEHVTFKSMYASAGYPTLPEGDNLIKVPNGVYRLILYRVQLTEAGSVIITQVADTLQFDRIKNAEWADDAGHAISAEQAHKLNGILIQHNAATDVLQVSREGTGIEILERKARIYHAPSGTKLHTNNAPVQLVLSENIEPGDVLEFVYTYRGLEIQRVMAWRDSTNETIVHLIATRAGSVWQNGFSMGSFYFKVSEKLLTFTNAYELVNFAREDGGYIDNGQIIVYAIYKVKGAA